MYEPQEAPKAAKNSASFVNQLKRSSLLEKMPEAQYQEIIQESLSFIERRFSTVRELIKVDKVNINPFLMLLMAPAYNIFSPLESAEYMQNTKVPHGDATAFGRFVEDRLLPIFNVSPVKEKKTESTIYSSIDGALSVEGVDYLGTWKAGPWTMNQSHAHEMSQHFPTIHDTSSKEIILGIFYGTPSQLNNKPRLVHTNTGDYFHVLIGSEFWEFITGVRAAHMVVLEAIREAQRQFAVKHGGKTFNEHMIEARLALARDFREKFGLTGGGDDMWDLLFRQAF